MENLLLVVAHAPSKNTKMLLDAVVSGASHEDMKEAVRVRHVPPLQAQAEDVLEAHALILGTTENFGYMSGALKDFFDRIYYPCLEKTEAMPYALYIKAGKDGTGTQRAVEAITAGLRWKAVQPALILKGSYQSGFISQCQELGMYMAAGMEAKLF